MDEQERQGILERIKQLAEQLKHARGSRESLRIAKEIEQTVGQLSGG